MSRAQKKDASVANTARRSGKKALVTGAGGFIAHHLVRCLKKDGTWVRGVDVKVPEYSTTQADEFLLLDLRDDGNCQKALMLDGSFDEVYHLAADMGGMGFINAAACEIMRNSALMNNHMIHGSAVRGIKRFFFSSSVCIYRDMDPGEPELTEEKAYPAMPDNEYGWEKLYAERMALAYGRKYGMAVRVARFQNCYGPEGAWTGGREKAPAAICRKIAIAPDGGTIEVWGNGSAVRSYTYIDDMIDGIYHLMHSDIGVPTNIGNPEYVTVQELVDVIAKVSGKKINVKYIEGPVGVRSRNFSNEKIASTGWKACFPLVEGIRLTYPWIKEQAKKAGLKVF